MQQSCLESNLEAPLVVNTTLGRVRGHVLRTLYDDVTYYCFDGVPYAAPPLGALRFKAPQDCAPWQDIRDCTTIPPKCLQQESYTKTIAGSEDCLYLNIYAKKLNSSKPLPVMVYLHGGRYKSGDPTRRDWAPDYFLQEHDIIYISIGFRLGAFGFLSFADPSLEVPGNAGLKDVVHALKWIQANVANFNGDPENVTLFGHSSGGYMTHLLTLCPQTEGLFHKAIVMSGCSQELNRLPQLEYRLAKHIGYEGTAEDDAAIYDFLNRADPADLSNIDFLTPQEIFRGMIVFSPCIEPYESETTLLRAEPFMLQRTAWSNRIPIMLGYTSDEFMLEYKNASTNTDFYELFGRNPEYLLPTTLAISEHCDHGMRRQLAKQFKEIFYGKELTFGTENFMQLLELKNYIICHAHHRLLESRVKYANESSSYLYRFSYFSPDFNLFHKRHVGASGPPGAVHGDELSYIFLLRDGFKLDKSSTEYKRIRQMVSMWCAFACNSDPNSTETASIKWTPVERFGPRMCIDINEELQIIEQPELDICLKIDNLYEQAGLDLC